MARASKTRTYDSSTRRAQAVETRRRVLAAAHELFVLDGLSVTVRQIAAHAQVSAATVELLFGTKVALLDAVVDVALAGDDEPVAVLDRPFVAELAARPAPAFLDGAGHAFAAGAARVSPLLAAVDTASQQDPRLAELSARLSRQRTVMATWVVDQVRAHDALAEDLTPTEAVEQVLIVLDPGVHRRLVLDQAWTTDRLGRWLARTLRRLLLDDPRPG